MGEDRRRRRGEAQEARSATIAKARAARNTLAAAQAELTTRDRKPTLTERCRGAPNIHEQVAMAKKKRAEMIEERKAFALT